MTEKNQTAPSPNPPLFNLVPPEKITELQRLGLQLTGGIAKVSGAVAVLARVAEKVPGIADVAAAVELVADGVNLISSLAANIAQTERAVVMPPSQVMELAKARERANATHLEKPAPKTPEAPAVVPTVPAAAPTEKPAAK